FVFWDPFMIDTSNELLNPVNLDCAHRGQLAELAFMRKAASLGFGVAKPWGEADRFDIIVRIGKGFLRVQVKSSLSTPNGRNSYRIKTTGGGGAYALYRRRDRLSRRVCLPARRLVHFPGQRSRKSQVGLRSTGIEEIEIPAIRRSLGPLAPG